MNLPEPVDARVEVKISKDQYSATICMFPPANGGKSLSADDIRAALKAQGVVFGIRQDLIDRLGNAPRYEMEFEVATGIPPVPGKDAFLTYCFETSREKKPAELPNGSVDFRELGVTQNVRKGDVLVIKTPPVLGRPGMNVLGKEVPPKPGREAPMPVGKNTHYSEDKLQLLASVDGQVDLMGSKVQVLDCFVVRGDVGPATGNIKFVGNVQVGGDVLAGYEIHAEGNIVIGGTVEGGSLFAGGNVVVSGGFNGMNKGLIEAAGDVRCKYLQNAEVSAEGLVECNSIISATVRSGSTIYTRGLNSAIMTSHLMARFDIECFNCGARNSLARTILEVGTDPYLMARQRAIPAEIEKSQKMVESLERAVGLFEKLKAQGRLAKDKESELLKLQRSLVFERDHLVELQLEKADVSQRIMATGYGNVNVQGTAYAGVLLLIGPEKKLLNNEYKFSLFSRTETGIEIGPAQSKSKR